MLDYRKGYVRVKVVLVIVTALLCMLVIYGLTGTRDVAIQSGYKDLPKWSREFYSRSESKAMHKKRLAASVMKVRLLCVILTMEKDLHSKVAAVNKTWAVRCDKHLYIITSKQKRHDFLNIDIPDTRNNLVKKIRKVFTAIYEQYMNDFDYVLKCDDDTYVIVENLKFLLWHYDANKPSYFGFHFNKFIRSGYMSGGAGYVISNRGVRQLVERGFQNGACELKIHEDDPENSEDIETGRCLETVGVPALNSLDAAGRETFHPYPLERHMFGQLPSYVYSWAKHPMRKGEDCCSRYSISFHYLTPDAIYYLDHVLYKTTVFGLDRDDDYDKPIFNSDNVLFET